ncbi:MAG: ABC transporter permease [Magnetococcus sp. DMHC-6]
MKRFYPVWITLGHLAYWRSFACKRSACAGGGRDFAWLTLLLALVISMALLLVGTRFGLLERFTDALLGTLRPYGVPIWVTSHWENHEGIQKNLIDHLIKAGTSTDQQTSHLAVHPYRRMEGGRPEITLPGSSSWKNSIPFVGWAVYQSDPLWRLDTPIDWNEESWKTSEEWLGLPLTIVLNEALFQSNFNFDSYLEAITPILRKQKQSIPIRPQPNQKLRDTMDTLWINITMANEETLYPFRIRWIPYIPTMEKIAYLFPLSTYHALLAAYHFPDLKYNPLNKGIGDIKQHDYLTNPGFPRDAISSYAACVQNAELASGLSSLPSVASSRCQPPTLPNHFKFANQVSTEETAWDTIDHDKNNQLWIPCHRLPRNDTLRSTLCPSWNRDKEASAPLFVPWDVTSYGTSFSAIKIYVPDPTRINRGIQDVLSIKTRDGRPALNIHPMYMDALNRFNLLSDMLAIMVPAYTLTFGLFLAFLLLAQMGTLISHRRQHYGILLSRGLTWSNLHAKLFFQMAITTLIGAILAVFGLVPVLRMLLDDGFKKVINNYQDFLPPGYDFEVLPLSVNVILLTLAGVYGVVIIVSFFLLMRMPLLPSTAPSELLHGNVNAPVRSRIQSHK